ncbi:MAG: DUF362 domain-containing protein [Acidobacteriota bacterium]
MSKVVVIECRSYDPEEVKTAISRGLDLLGGTDRIFNKSENVLLKPNILVGDNPDKGVITHPEIFNAVAETLQKNNLNLSYGDSPGFGSPKRAAEKSGLSNIAKKKGIKLADFETIVHSPFEKGIILKNIPIAKGVLESDAIVSISKMKTHGFTRITGAVKNQFGCVPGLLKSEFHVKMPDIFDFSKVLIDINNFLKPQLYIMDGIIAMEGNGPRGGELISMNVILFSKDPVALDSVFCKLIDLDPEFVPTMKFGMESGLGTFKYNEIDILGDYKDSLINKKFKVVRKPPDRFISSKNFPPFLKNLISPKPVIDYEMCVNCGKCVLQCPTDPKSVDWSHKKHAPYPSFDYNSCIRCYCCQELCPHKAITIKTPLLGKIIGR